MDKPTSMPDSEHLEYVNSLLSLRASYESKFYKVIKKMEKSKDDRDSPKYVKLRTKKDILSNMITDINGKLNEIE